VLVGARLRSVVSRGVDPVRHCILCDVTVADLWRWCPDCGGELREEERDPRKPAFVLGWYGEYVYSLTDGAS
jgi:predicted nucleic acid-binding Zn ribbon protein